MGAAVVFLFVPLALFLVVWTHKARSSLIERQREEIARTLAARRLHGANAAFAFDPISAVLVHEVEEVRGETPLVQSTKLYRNPEGEYFFFVCTAGNPGFIKHLSREEAQRMLKPYASAYAAEFRNRRSVGQDGR